jgi:hypothetical protein
MRWTRTTRHLAGPAGRRTARRLGAVASGLLLATGLALANAPAAAADQSVAIGVAGNLRFGLPPNSLDAALVQLTDVTAGVDDFGNFTVPAGVAIGSQPNPPPGVPDLLLHSGPITAVRVTAQSPLSGAIDPGSMTMTMSGQLAYTFTLGAFECTTQTQDARFTSTGLDLATQTATLAPDGRFSIPAIAWGAPNCPDDQAQLVDSLLRLPTERDMAALTLTLSLSPSGPPTTPAPPSSDPGTTPPSASPGSTGAAVLGTTAAPKASSKPSASKQSGTNSKSKSKSKSAATGTTGETTTTAYQYNGGAFDLPEDSVGTPTPNAVAAPRAPESTANISDAGSNHFGLGLIVLMVGGLLGAVYLLRSEGARLFRRRDRAAF